MPANLSLPAERKYRERVPVLEQHLRNFAAELVRVEALSETRELRRAIPEQYRGLEVARLFWGRDRQGIACYIRLVLKRDGFACTFHAIRRVAKGQVFVSKVSWPHKGERNSAGIIMLFLAGARIDRIQKTVLALCGRAKEFAGVRPHYENDQVLWLRDCLYRPPPLRADCRKAEEPYFIVPYRILESVLSGKRAAS
jgi:hypothetical protein